MSDNNRGGYFRRGAVGAPQGNSRFGTAQPRRATPQAAPQRYGAPRDRALARGSAAYGRPVSRGAAGGQPDVRVDRPRSVNAPKSRPESGIGGRLPNGFWMLAGVCAIVIAVGVVLQLALPGGFPLARKAAESPQNSQMITEIHSRGPLRINEIMTANSGVLSDANGEMSDWVEIANVGSGAVNMKGYVLARNAKAGNVFVFPDMTIQPNECVIVYADSRLQAEPGEELHAPFRLSSTGDVLMLFNQADVAIDTVNIPALQDNTVYARTGVNTWAVSDKATPGALNTEENYRAMSTVVSSGDVQICELMATNASYAPDENGVCHDYVVLRTISGSGADLSGWYLSDSQQLPRMWRFPDGASVPAGGTLVVHCSGLNRLDDMSHLHTNFKLSSEGEQVVLSNAEGRPVDLVTFDLIKTDSAYVRGADGNWSVGTPTVASKSQ